MFQTTISYTAKRDGHINKSIKTREKKTEGFCIDSVSRRGKLSSECNILHCDVLSINQIKPNLESLQINKCMIGTWRVKMVIIIDVGLDDCNVIILPGIWICR